ncbi:MobC family plasmid mobilization relaxosome protein [Methylobacterium radiotolerans]|uniref:MobC family plasmid mobilization relaxosome protein n=1 Tax=Methylobacterium radiotolerans TaxID=31998 RepID=UPI0009FAF66B|nr:MobC family plasmid mobilization relaxosome protein [Methylobacterium radiotolerans]
MPARSGQKMVGAYVDADLADRFAAWARQTEGGASAALRRLMLAAMDGKEPVAPRGSGKGEQVGVRLKAPERAALNAAAKFRGTSPANWLRSLAIVHLARKPQWNPAELDELRSVFKELRRIGNNVNQIAHALNVAAHTGLYPPHQGFAVREASEAIRNEMRRVVALMTSNFDYWGLPLDERPRPSADAIEQRDAEARAAETKRRARPRRRPAKFDEG